MTKRDPDFVQLPIMYETSTKYWYSREKPEVVDNGVTGAAAVAVSVAFELVEFVWSWLDLSKVCWPLLTNVTFVKSFIISLSLNLSLFLLDSREREERVALFFLCPLWKWTQNVELMSRSINLTLTHKEIELPWRWNRLDWADLWSHLWSLWMKSRWDDVLSVNNSSSLWPDLISTLAGGKHRKKLQSFAKLSVFSFCLQLFVMK